MPMRLTTLLLAASVAVSCFSGGGSKSTPTLESAATPSAAEVARLNQAADRFLNVAHAQVQLDVAFSGLPERFRIAEFSAELQYTAPTALAGVVTTREGPFSVIIRDDRTFASRGEFWIEHPQPMSYRILREYGGGLIDLHEIIGNLTSLRTTGSDIAGDLPRIGLNSYLFRSVEGIAMGSALPLLATRAEFRLHRQTGSLQGLLVTGNSEVDGLSVPFTIDVRFSSFNDVEASPDVPEATPHPLLNESRPTPEPAGCALDGTVLSVDVDLGRVYEQGERIEAAVHFNAPSCRGVAATFHGEYVSGSERYEAICRKQCTDAVFAEFRTGQRNLDPDEGVVTLAAVDGPYPPDPPISPGNRTAGFRLCSFDVNVNDGHLGGNSFSYELPDVCED